MQAILELCDTGPLEVVTHPSPDHNPRKVKDERANKKAKWKADDGTEPTECLIPVAATNDGPPYGSEQLEAVKKGEHLTEA